MMNSVFESKIIDFGLVHASLTRGIGILAHMSPEMVNEEEYDSKTDIYLYGIVLVSLFTGSLLKQSMRDRMNNVAIEYPKASDQISKYCIMMIKHQSIFNFIAI